MSATLDKIMCRLIKNQIVTFGDIVDHVTHYVFIYSELIMVICLSPVIAAIYNPQAFDYVVLCTPITFISVIIPFMFIPFLLKYILTTVGLYDNISEMKIAECPKNSEIVETEKRVASNIKDTIKLLLGVLILILMIILVAEMIYYNKPIYPIQP